MPRTNVAKWSSEEYERSHNQEKQAKFFVAETIQSYLAGACNVGEGEGEYPPLTPAEWRRYVWDTIAFNKAHDDESTTHLYFAGQNKIEDLVSIYIQNDDEASAHTKWDMHTQRIGSAKQ